MASLLVCKRHNQGGPIRGDQGCSEAGHLILSKAGIPDSDSGSASDSASASASVIRHSRESGNPGLGLGIGIGTPFAESDKTFVSCCPLAARTSRHTHDPLEELPANLALFLVEAHGHERAGDFGVIQAVQEAHDSLDSLIET
jgi:hypothetical protein